MSHKSIIEAFLKSLETGDPAPLAHAGRYTQHNLAVADGIEGLRALLGSLPAGSTRVRTVRLLEDGDFVVAHSEYELLGPKVGFDIFRFEGDAIAEHWDNLGARVAAPNASGRTQTDGPTEVRDRDRTAANKALVAEFVQTVLLDQQLGKAAGFVDGYLQHNPLVADGLPALGIFLEKLASNGTPIVYDKLHRVLGEGNFVLAVSEGRFGKEPTAFYDLFRVEGDKLAEHWDVVFAKPTELGHDNGLF